MNPSTITFSNTFPKNKEDIILGIDMNINSNINCIIICILDVPIDKIYLFHKFFPLTIESRLMKEQPSQLT